MDSRDILEKIAASMLRKLFMCLDTKRYTIVDRDKNREFLAMNGFALEDQLNILRSLTPGDCVKAEPDRDDSNGQDLYWFHIKHYEGIPVYVKYKIVLIKMPDCEQDYAIIKSIHEDGY